MPSAPRHADAYATLPMPCCHLPRHAYAAATLMPFITLPCHYAAAATLMRYAASIADKIAAAARRCQLMIRRLTLLMITDTPL